VKGHDNDGVGFDEAGTRACTLSVVVPTRNEALNVGPLAVRLQSALSHTAGGWELIFVDDSDDTTPEVLARLADEVGVGSAVRLLHRPRGMRSGGLGGAVRDGFAIARGRVVAVMDADLQHPPEVLPALIVPVLSGEADLVAGSRYGWAGADAGLSSPWRHLVSGGCRWLVHLVVPDSRPLQDPLSGLFALRRSLLDGVELRPAGYKILLEVTARARPARVGNLGFNFGPRHAGRSKANLREGLVFLRHLARLVGASRSRRADRPERPVAVELLAVDLRGKQLLEPVEKR
jgi:dolichol-phosphate mannosyltransferase